MTEEQATELQEIIVSCECEHIEYVEQLETIIQQQENIYNEVHNINQLFKTGFMFFFIVFIMVIIYKFLKMFF